MDNSEVSRSIVSSFERYSGGPQGKPQTTTKEKKADCWDVEAQNFIRRNPNWDRRETSDVENLTQFLSKYSVSFLALRNEDAVTFLDILEKVCASRTYGPVPAAMHGILNAFIDVGCAQ